MRLLALCLVLLAAPDVACAEDTVFKVGLTTRDFIPADLYDWRGAKTHALRATIWYPAEADAREGPQWTGPRIVPLFSAGNAARDAEPAPGPRRPLIVLSHGNGGAAFQLAWLGTGLTRHGYIVVAVNHPGNNALEDYRVEGMSLWWLRAVDLSAIIDAMLVDRTFGSLIDPARIGAAVIRSAATPSSRSPVESVIRNCYRCSAARLRPTCRADRRRPLPSCAGRPSRV